MHYFLFKNAQQNTVVNLTPFLCQKIIWGEKNLSTGHLLAEKDILTDCTGRNNKYFCPSFTDKTVWSRKNLYIFTNCK